MDRATPPCVMSINDVYKNIPRLLQQALLPDSRYRDYAEA